MTDVSLDQFLPLVLPYVRDCPDLVARSALRSAAIEFCNETHWWIANHVDLTQVAAVNHYELDPPDDADIVSIMEIRANGQQLVAKGVDELDLMFGGYWRTSLTGQPRYYTREQPGEVLLIPTPDQTVAQGLKFTVALRPTQDAEYLPEELYRRWAEDLAYGARSRLHEMPGQIFYDEGAAMKYRAKFLSAISKARVERAAGMTRGPIGIRMPEVF